MIKYQKWRDESTNTMYKFLGQRRDSSNLKKNQMNTPLVLTILHQIVKSTIIPHSSAPKSAMKLTEMSIITCGFDLLFEIVNSQIPQLGGEYMDLHKYRPVHTIRWRTSHGLSFVCIINVSRNTVTAR